MELSRRDRLSELVEELTTSGEQQLNQDKMKDIKRICKSSNESIEHVYNSVMSQLNQEHSEVRLSAFQICSELFSRSHHFRTLLVDNFQEFLELTVETDSEQPLPPPKEVARRLRSQAIQTVQSWQAAYGSAYKKLALGYHFLKQVKKVDFQDAERTRSERSREEERQRKMERIYKERVEAATKDMEESYEEMEATLTEMETCMKLLLPEFDLTGFHTANSGEANTQPANSREADVHSANRNEADIQSTNNIAANSKQTDDNEEPCCSKELKDGEIEGGIEEGDEEEEKEEVVDENSFIRNSGLISHSYNLDLNLTPGLHVKETEDNEAVVSTVIDLHKLIKTKHLPAVQSWVQVFTKAGADQLLLRRALDLKSSLEHSLQKHKELHIDYKTRIRRVMKASSDSDESDEDDFDEVPEKEGYEPHIPEELREEYGLDPLPSMSSAPVTKKNLPVNRQTASHCTHTQTQTQTQTQTRPNAASSSTVTSSTSSYSSKRRLKRRLEEEMDPTCAAATLSLLRKNLPLSARPSTSSGSSPVPSSSHSSEQKTSDVPVVPFGLDLYYWGQEQPNAGKIVKSASQHQFWVHAEVDEEAHNQELQAESSSRFISFPGTFTPVGHRCNAPLGQGRLCTRQDRVKCPFHGPIVPRDEAGRPLRLEDRVREEREERKRREENPEWHDAELMRDIEAATGADLGSDRVGKKRKAKKKKHPNLSDLKQNANTARARLERKVFNKSTMRRVADVLSKADGRKHEKFSNQFNYALK